MISTPKTPTRIAALALASPLLIALTPATASAATAPTDHTAKDKSYDVTKDTGASRYARPKVRSVDIHSARYTLTTNQAGHDALRTVYDVRKVLDPTAKTVQQTFTTIVRLNKSPGFTLEAHKNGADRFVVKVVDLSRNAVVNCPDAAVALYPKSDTVSATVPTACLGRPSQARMHSDVMAMTTRGKPISADSIPNATPKNHGVTVPIRLR